MQRTIEVILSLFILALVGIALFILGVDIPQMILGGAIVFVIFMLITSRKR